MWGQGWLVMIELVLEGFVQWQGVSVGGEGVGIRDLQVGQGWVVGRNWLGYLHLVHWSLMGLWGYLHLYSRVC